MAAKLMLLLIRFYRCCISPLIPPRCRYVPTCSQYALEAVQKYGAVKGGWMALKRIARCHPFGSHGHDPLP
ncbi:MAG: membrane protein insertion efficiency factor YidD [Neisseria sp.]|nr:membrane protein insertion efficiency factor YidD [Neisseria sp.]